MNLYALMIGGSAGSFHTVTGILKSLPVHTDFPVFLCLHRLKQLSMGFREVLQANSSLPVVEPEDKTRVCNGIVYLAPANYHMMIENDFRISLSTDEPIYHSRPSIDLCIASAADTYHKNMAGILLSGANRDGTKGFAELKRHNGLCIIQDPHDCEISTMCTSALTAVKPDKLLNTNQIIEFVSLLKK
ncbi:MAG: hypothetical protein AMS27_00135 [Bacteroides sp. SM23_62_1]|nr:MAG: hypothetical protein AMS27_00135 [Bacteroides sp. SM23_62_1]